MRTHLTFLIFMAFFSGWLRADVYKEQRTGVEFPEKIGGFKRSCARPAAYMPFGWRDRASPCSPPQTQPPFMRLLIFERGEVLCPHADDNR